MKSDLINLETGGVLKKIMVLDLLDSGLGIIKVNRKLRGKGQRGSLLMYTRGAYDDAYAKDNAKWLLDTHGLSVTNVSRNLQDKSSIIEILVQSSFFEKELSIKYPHEEY